MPTIITGFGDAGNTLATTIEAAGVFEGIPVQIPANVTAMKNVGSVWTGTYNVKALPLMVVVDAARPITRAV